MILFAPFVANENDPLWMFNDGVFHAVCVTNHPLGVRAHALHEELLQKTTPQNRRCAISGEPIVQPDHYVSVGVLTSDPQDPLYRYNSAQYDQRALSGSTEGQVLAGLLDDALAAGRVKGKGVDHLRRQMTGK